MMEDAAQSTTANQMQVRHGDVDEERAEDTQDDTSSEPDLVDSSDSEDEEVKAEVSEDEWEEPTMPELTGIMRKKRQGLVLTEVKRGRYGYGDERPDIGRDDDDDDYGIDGGDGYIDHRQSPRGEADVVMNATSARLPWTGIPSMKSIMGCDVVQECECCGCRGDRWSDQGKLEFAGKCKQSIDADIGQGNVEPFKKITYGDVDVVGAYMPRIESGIFAKKDRKLDEIPKGKPNERGDTTSAMLDSLTIKESGTRSLSSVRAPDRD